MNLRLGFLVFCAAILSACSTLSGKGTAKREIVLERRWARHTPKIEYSGYRLSHVMEPMVDGAIVISGNEIDGITGYNKNSGQEIWHRSINGGVTASARVKNGVIFFGAGDGFFYALDTKTGATRWSFPIRSEGIGAPLITDQAIYFVTGTNSAYALNPEPGAQIWFYNRQDSANITVRGASEPTEIEDKIYIGFSDGYLVALDKSKGTMVWEKQLNSNIRFRDVDAKPVYDEGNIYVSSYDGQLYCLSAKTGETVWTNDQGGFTPVTIEGGRIYYSTSSRKLQAIDKASGKIVWSIDLKNTVASQPVYYKGLIFIGEWDGKLRAVNADTGVTVATFNTGRGVTAKPTFDLDSSSLYVITRDANLFALKVALKSKMEDWPWRQ